VTDVGVAEACAAAASALVGATVQASIGFGMNLVTVPVIALVVPEALPASVVLLGLPISVAMLRHEHHAVDRRGVAWVLVGRVPGTALGAWVVATLATDSLALLVGAFVLAAVGASLVAPPLPVHARSQLVGGAVSGLTGTAAGIGGPPLALLYQRHPGPTMRSTLAASFFFGTLLSTVVLAAAGEVGGREVGLAALMLPFVVAGSVVGRRLHGWLDRGWLRPAVLAFAAVSAVVVIADALA
jgi:hypothetical protein